MNHHQIAQALRTQAAKLVAAADLIAPKQRTTTTSTAVTRTYVAKRTKRTMSAAARRKLSRLAKARWAAIRSASGARKVGRPRKLVALGRAA